MAEDHEPLKIINNEERHRFEAAYIRRHPQYKELLRPGFNV